ncbi:hypothetical protein VNI00_006494 [Paramarasmius palmivorus]|uniref:Uncharacterized protein n=1 Tax=Paramarasmius palmivorus TaxID=297713 RepID=A0AAW0D8C4_9AGAR
MQTRLVGLDGDEEDGRKGRKKRTGDDNTGFLPPQEQQQQENKVEAWLESVTVKPVAPVPPHVRGSECDPSYSGKPNSTPPDTHPTSIQVNHIELHTSSTAFDKNTTFYAPHFTCTSTTPAPASFPILKTFAHHEQHLPIPEDMSVPTTSSPLVYLDTPSPHNQQLLPLPIIEDIPVFPSFPSSGDSYMAPPHHDPDQPAVEDIPLPPAPSPSLAHIIQTHLSSLTPLLQTVDPHVSGAIMGVLDHVVQLCSSYRGSGEEYRMEDEEEYAESEAESESDQEGDEELACDTSLPFIVESVEDQEEWWDTITSIKGDASPRHSPIQAARRDLDRRTHSCSERECMLEDVEASYMSHASHMHGRRQNSQKRSGTAPPCNPKEISQATLPAAKSSLRGVGFE